MDDIGDDHGLETTDDGVGTGDESHEEDTDDVPGWIDIAGAEFAFFASATCDGDRGWFFVAGTG